MHWRSSMWQGVRVMAALGLTGALFTTGGDTLLARGGDADGQGGLAGTWFVQVTLRDCTTSAPIGAPFNSLVTFHAGGTISEAAGGLAFAPGQRGPGHGTWERQGRHAFEQRMVALLLFDSPANLPGTPGFNPALPITPGFFAGWQTVTHTLKLRDANHATSAGTNAFFKADGTLYRTGCSTAAAERF